MTEYYKNPVRRLSIPLVRVETAVWYIRLVMEEMSANLAKNVNYNMYVTNTSQADRWIQSGSTSTSAGLSINTTTTTTANALKVTDSKPLFYVYDNGSRTWGPGENKPDITLDIDPANG